MDKRSPSVIVAEVQSDNSLAGWFRLQRSLADRGGISVATLNRDGAVIGRIENDGSLCQAMRVARASAPLCAADCGCAFERASHAGKLVHFKCHAGLSCFATPVDVEGERIVILGGRVFTSTRDYDRFLSEYELNDDVRGDMLRNVNFVDSRDLEHSAALIDSTAASHFARPELENSPAPPASVSPGLLDAHLEIIRLTDQLEAQKPSVDLNEFLRGVASTLDSQRAYNLVLSRFREVLGAERSSLMVFDEESGELSLQAAIGFGLDVSSRVRVKLGDPVCGAVLATGTAMLVEDVESDGRVSAQRPGRYRSGSFISFPITIGPRRIGVVNLTEKLNGTPFQEADLELLDAMAPHLALIIDRTEWHRKAEAYQRMSLTDPLTGLPNRRYLEDRLFEEAERSKRYGTPLSFMIIDVDHFKSFNDIHGHTNADRVLVRTGQILRGSIRAIDTAARFAGDEFCVVLPETELLAAAAIAERLRASVSRTEFRTEQGAMIGRVTISIGISSFGAGRQSPLSIIQAADRALYQAKTRGRDRVAACEEEGSAGGNARTTE
jgi:diguanylate cyclase (GGDEF)-like protein